MSRERKYITVIVIGAAGGSILKKLMLSAIVGLWLIVMISGVASAGALTAEAELLSIGGSGVTAEITFVDTGTSLIVTGEAEGLDPSAVYVSLIYDVGSVATGPTACEPTIGPGAPGFLTEAQMFQGFWLPMGSSERTLTVTHTGASYTGVGTFATVSVRQVFSFVPLNVPVRACGVVVTQD